MVIWPISQTWDKSYFELGVAAKLHPTMQRGQTEDQQPSEGKQHVLPSYITLIRDVQ